VKLDRPVSRRGRNRAKLIAASLCAFSLIFVFAASAGASTWKVSEISDGGAQGILWGVSCPTESFCVTVGTNSVVATSTNPTGGAPAWSIAHLEPVFLPPMGGSGSSYPGNAIRGVSCPTVGLCVAAGPQGHLFTSINPTGGASAWSLNDLGLSAAHMNGVSCASPSLCVAVAANGKIITSSDPTGGVAAWTVTKLAEGFDLRGVSCPSTSLCVAVDLEGNILSSTNPTGGAAAWTVARAPAGPNMLNGISCPSPGLCVTANPGQILTSTAPASGSSSWQAIVAGTGLPVSAVSCPSTSACAAIDNNADVIVSTDPTAGPAAWSFTSVIPKPSVDTASSPRNGMYGISCPSEALCVAVGADRQIITSTDPFSVKSTAKLPSAGKSMRPRALITSHPLKRVNPRKGGVRVGFRFRAVGAAKGFKCTLRGHKFSPCKSPRRYRLGRGTYAFKVRAIGPTGLQGPPATFHFRVGEVTERGPVPTCPPGQESSLGKACQTPR
jgi:hypothetical protein